MLFYYFSLAMRSFKRNKVLTSLIMFAIALGIGASITMLTVLRSMSGDPIPGVSKYLYYPHLDPSPPGFSDGSFDPGEYFTWRDANALLLSQQAHKQAMIAGGEILVRPEKTEIRPFYANGRYASSQFFDLFNAPFSQGTGWTAEDDAQRTRVIVLNGELARKLFGNDSAVGRDINLQNMTFRVVGVLNDWHPKPLFYGGSRGDSAFKTHDEFFLPLTTAMERDFTISGGTTCWGDDSSRTSDECTWIQFWVRLNDPHQVEAYRRFLLNYWSQERRHGRFAQPTPPNILSLDERLNQLRLVPTEVHLQASLAIAFLLICALNITGMLLAKFQQRTEEICVRRALGAKRFDIFLQLGIESATLGVASSVFGLSLAYLGLWHIHQRPDGYARLAHMDLMMLLAAVLLSVSASVLAGLLPAWRACRIEPARQLKSQ